MRVLSLALAVCSAPDLFAQNNEGSAVSGPNERRSMRAMRLTPEERVELDGRLDEPVWKRAIPATGFIQQDPKNGAPATERTEVRIAFDRENLYMGVLCFDSDPRHMKGNQMLRDGFLPADDRFMWTIDPFLNGINGYFFETNPSGAMGDALIMGAAGGGGGATNIRGWDGIWYEKVRRSDMGWTLEIKIPFRTLAFDPKAPAWGINFQRTVRRINEDSLWTGWRRNENLNRMANAGLLEGISDVSQGMGIAAQPYVIGKLQDARGLGQPQTLRGTFGGDLSTALRLS